MRQGKRKTREAGSARSTVRSRGYRALMFVGGGLVAATGLIHLHLWAGTYSSIPTIGNMFLAQSVAGILLGLGIIVLRKPILAIAGAGFLAASLGGLVLALQGGVFGYEESIQGPFVKLVLIIETVGLLLIAAALAARGRSFRKSSVSQAAQQQEPAAPKHSEPEVAPAEASSQAGASDRPTPLKWRSGSVAPTAAEPLAGDADKAPAQQDSQTRSDRWVLASANRSQASPSKEPTEQPAPAPEPKVDERPARGHQETTATADSSQAPIPMDVRAGMARPAVVTGAESQQEAALMAAQREETILADRQRALGADHPATQMARVNLAYYLRSAGDYEAAFEVQEKVLEDAIFSLGPTHPRAITARRDYEKLKKIAKKAAQPT